MIAQLTLTKTQKYCQTFALALALTLTWTTIAHADGPGDLDITFGGTGIITTPISGYDVGLSVVLQTDDKIVVSGEISGDVGVIRYNSDGSLDTSFNGTGIVTTSITNLTDVGDSVAIQPDGKIVIGGHSGYQSPGHPVDFAVVRYNNDGSLDTTFNSTGIVTTPVASQDEFLSSIALQPDGKILLAGFSGTSLLYFTVIRYTSDGNLDTTFNNTGIVTTTISGKSAHVHAIALQPDEKILVAGEVQDSGGNYNFAVVRYNSDGSLDTTFNGTGIVTTPISSGYDIANSIVIQPDDKIVVVGGSDFNAFALVRYDNNGDLDLTFNGTGVVTTPFNGSSYVGWGAAIQDNGKIVVAGDGQKSGSFIYDIAVARYNIDGSLDSTFGDAGISMTSSGNDSMARSVAIQPDGKIVVAGASEFNFDLNFIVVRYHGDLVLPALTKTVSNNTPNPGQLITYTLSISNSSSFSTTNLLISDTLPVSLTLAGPATLEPSQPGAILATSPLSLPTVASSVTISPMTGLTVTIPVTVSTELSLGMHITNTATMTSPEMSISVSDVVVIAIASGASDKVYLPVILKN